MLHAGTCDECQRISIYVNGLEEPLKSALQQHNPQAMETVISWVLEPYWEGGPRDAVARVWGTRGVDTGEREA
jgi:hypothetical protein